jgi:hypothetical protein
LKGQKLPSDKMLPAAWKLVPGSITARTNNVAGRARSLPSRFGVPFVGGAYLVPVVAVGEDESPAQKLLTMIDNLATEMAKTATELRPEWEHWVATGCANEYGRDSEAYRQLSQHFVDGETFVRQHVVKPVLFPVGGYPSKGELVKRFTEEVQPLVRKYPTIGSIIPALAEVAATSSVIAANRTDAASAASWAATAQETTCRELARSVKAMLDEPLGEFAESLRNFEGMLARRSNIGKPQMEKLRRDYEKMAGFAFLLPEDLGNRLNEVKRKIDTIQPADLNGDVNASTAERLAGYFRGIATDLKKPETQGSVLDGFVRSISV